MRSKNIGTQISSGKAEKTYEKLANDTDREEQDNQRVALLFGNYSYISHSYNFKPRTRENGNTWKVIIENFTSYR